MEDNRLFALIQQNDHTSFEQLFNKYSSELCVLAFHYIKQDDGAQDIVQEFFIGLWQKRHSLQINSSFKAYAYKSIYHASLNFLRSNKRSESHKNSYLLQEAAEFEEGITSLDNAPSPIRENLNAAIESLPAQCRKIFILVCINEMKYAEVAALTGLSINTIKVQMSKAYRILREKIDPASLAFLLLLENF